MLRMRSVGAKQVRGVPKTFIYVRQFGMLIYFHLPTQRVAAPDDPLTYIVSY